MSSLQAQPTADTAFIQDKQRFFKDNRPMRDCTQALKQVRAEAMQHDHTFLASHRVSLEEELNQLLVVLKQEANHDEALALYAYYCCTLLATYYSPAHYNSAGAAQKYQAQAKALETFYQTGHFPTEKIRTLTAQLSADIQELLSTPRHASALRSWIGWGNINRLAFTFSRLTVQQLLTIAQQKQWLAMLSRVLKMPLDLNDMTARINTPSSVFRFLSVGFFATRFMINAGLLLKHTFLPTEGEKGIRTDARFYQELRKRYAVMLNDVVWTVLNALTNYAEMFGVSAPFANTLLIIGLTFDVSLLVWRLHEAEGIYTAQRAQYVHEKNTAQIAILDIQMQAKRAAFGANIAAASLLTLGYSASLILAFPAGVVASYFVIVVGIALYYAADAYGAYEEKRQMMNHTRLTGDDNAVTLAKKEAQDAWNNFGMIVLKNTFGPLIFMGALAISWEAAIVVTAVYLASEAYRYSQKTAGAVSKPSAPEIQPIKAPTETPCMIGA